MNQLPPVVILFSDDRFEEAFDVAKTLAKAGVKRLDLEEFEPASDFAARLAARKPCLVLSLVTGSDGALEGAVSFAGHTLIGPDQAAVLLCHDDDRCRVVLEASGVHTAPAGTTPGLFLAAFGGDEPAFGQSDDQRMTEAARQAWTALGLHGWAQFGFVASASGPALATVEVLPDLGTEDGFRKNLEAGGHSWLQTLETMVLAAEDSRQVEAGLKTDFKDRV